MNEIELIRAQLATERSHAAQVANACLAACGSAGAAPPQAFRDACVDYLVWVLSRFEQRDQLLAERLNRGLANAAGTLEDTLPGELAELAARTGSSREALSRLEAALDAPRTREAHAAWHAFGQFFNAVWNARRIAIERQLAHLPRAAHWRALSVVDADAILEERARYLRIAELLPPGVTLISTGIG